MQKEYPQIYATLIKNRNDAWMSKLQPMLNDNNSELVLVGALHLAGKDGLLQQLTKLGYSIEQL